MIRFYFSFFIFIFFIKPVFAQTKFTEKKIGHEYYLNIPDYMLRCSGLNEDASAQFQNNSKDLYLYIIEESKEELKSLGIFYQNVNEYYESFIKDYALDTKNRVVYEPKMLTNKSTSIIQTEMEYTSNDIPIYMVITIAEGVDYFYNIVCWTSTQNKDKLKIDMLKIGSSFKEN
jgi:hypothetical protein